MCDRRTEVSTVRGVQLCGPLLCPVDTAAGQPPLPLGVPFCTLAKSCKLHIKPSSCRTQSQQHFMSYHMRASQKRYADMIRHVPRLHYALYASVMLIGLRSAGAATPTVCVWTI